jgi:hypothetical protein
VYYKRSRKHTQNYCDKIHFHPTEAFENVYSSVARETWPNPLHLQQQQHAGNTEVSTTEAAFNLSMKLRDYKI